MEYAPNGDLGRFIKKGNELKKAFPEEIIWKYFMQICEGLQALHNAKIIHRDIKPMNIFVGDHDVVKVCITWQTLSLQYAPCNPKPVDACCVHLLLLSLTMAKCLDRGTHVRILYPGDCWPVPSILLARDAARRSFYQACQWLSTDKLTAFVAFVRAWPMHESRSSMLLANTD